MKSTDLVSEKAQQLYQKQLDLERTRNLSANLMARISRRIISLWEFAKLLGKLTDENEFICVNRNGDMYRGKVKIEKLTLLEGIYPAIRRVEYVDESKTIHQLLDGTSIIQQQGKGFPNRADTRGRLYKEVVSYDADVFMELIENVSSDKITEERVQNLHGHNYRKVSVKGVRMIGYFSVITNKLHFLEIDGKEYWVN